MMIQSQPLELAEKLYSLHRNHLTKASGANMSFQKFKANCMDSTRQHHLNTRDWTLALVAHRAWSLDIYTSIMNGE